MVRDLEARFAANRALSAEIRNANAEGRPIDQALVAELRIVQESAIGREVTPEEAAAFATELAARFGNFEPSSDAAAVPATEDAPEPAPELVSDADGAASTETRSAANDVSDPPAQEPAAPVGQNTIFGNGEDERLVGTTADDRIIGAGGDDTISGRGGDDRLFGNDGDDRIFGGGGDDVIAGGDGNDRLFGGGGDDVVAGGAGNDRIFGGTGEDVLSGGTGADRFIFRNGDDNDTVIDFENDVDLLVLRGFGFEDADAALSNATQDGNDVVFALNGDDTLRVEDITIAVLADDILV